MPQTITYSARIDLTDDDRRDAGIFAHEFALKKRVGHDDPLVRATRVGKLGERAVERFLKLNNKIVTDSENRWKVWVGRNLGDDGDFKTKHEERVDVKTKLKFLARLEFEAPQNSRMAYYVLVQLSEDEGCAHIVGYLPYKQIVELTQPSPGPWRSISHSDFWPIDGLLDQFDDAPDQIEDDSPDESEEDSAPAKKWKEIVLLLVVVVVLAIVGFFVLNSFLLRCDNFKVQGDVRFSELEFLADPFDDICGLMFPTRTPTTMLATRTPTALPATLAPTTLPATPTLTTVPATPTPTAPRATPTLTAPRATPMSTTPPATPTSTTPPATPTPTLLYDPNGPDRNCGDFDNWRQAQDFYLAAGGPETDRHRLDSNRDGVACESRPGAP